MRVSKIIEVLQRRREFLLERMVGLSDADKGYHWLNQEQRAIECAMPILELELGRRHLAVMDQRLERESA